MRPRLVTIGILLLMMALVLVGLTGCERKAESREPESTEAAEATEAAESPGGGEEAPSPGETIVSAVTPGTPVTLPEQTTEAPAGETPVSSAPTATTEAGSPPPAATEEPTAAPPPPSDSTSGSYVWHTVQRGETLASIGRRYGVSWQTIAQVNSLSNPNQIYTGQKLKIPTSGSAPSSPPSSSGCRVRHTVKSGEWVWQIARNYGVSPYDILAANGMSIQSARTIHPGTVLCIP